MDSFDRFDSYDRFATLTTFWEITALTALTELTDSTALIHDAKFNVSVWCIAVKSTPWNHLFSLGLQHQRPWFLSTSCHENLHLRPTHSTKWRRVDHVSPTWSLNWDYIYEEHWRKADGGGPEGGRTLRLESMKWRFDGSRLCWIWPPGDVAETGRTNTPRPGRLAGRTRRQGTSFLREQCTY